MTPTNLQQTTEIAIINPFSAQKRLAFHQSEYKTQNDFVCDVLHLSSQLPDTRYIVNLCQNRYYFAVAFCALAIRNIVNLLPGNKQTTTLENLGRDYQTSWAIADCEGDFPLQTIQIAKQLENVDRNPIQHCPSVPFTQVAAIAFTSGSTGKPVANPKIWGTLATTARLLASRFIANNDVDLVIVGTVPAQHMYGLETTIMLPLQAGLMFDSAKPFFPMDIKQTLDVYSNRALLITTPIHLRTMIQSTLEMPDIYAVVSATAPLDLQIAEKSQAMLGTEVWEIFGCTEAGSMATRRPTGSHHWHLLDGFTLTQTAEGTIATAPHLTTAAIIQDQITIESPEHFVLSGRATDLINIAGKRSSLSDLTIQLLEINGVEDGVVFLPQKENAEVRPAAFVVSRLSEKELIAALALKIDPAFIPRPLKIIQSLPRNETGKISRETIEQLWEEYHAN